MEIKNKINGLCIAALCLLAFACETPNMEKGVTYNKGLLNFSVKIPGESSEYSATKTGPYKDGDTIYIKVPTSDDNPLDLTHLKPIASLENNCYVTPILDCEMDFTNPVAFTTVDGIGVKRTNIVKVLPTPPKTLFKKLWFKNATELNVIRNNISGIAAAGDNLYIHDADIWSAADGVKVYDLMTGTYKSTIPAPTTFTMQVKTDEVGHILVNRYNEYRAGFMVYYYENETSPAKLILNYAADAGCPSVLGSKMSVTGNLKEGKGYVYAAAPGSKAIYSWEFNDGVPVSETPNILRYASVKEDWAYASVKRASTAPDSECYITYCVYDGGDSEKEEKGSRFDIFPPTMELTQMNPKNNRYKILDFDVFEINGDRFLVTLEQGFWSWDGNVLKVYEITDKNSLTLVPDDADYNKFKLFESEEYASLNYNKWGDVACVVKGNEVYMYASIASGNVPEAGVMAYKMTYNPESK